MSALLLDLRTAARSLALLRRELGTAALARLLPRLLWRLARGAPWRGLPPAVEPREKAARAQSGPAIALYDILCELMPPEKARRLTGEVIAQGALLFLSEVVPPIERAAYRSWPQARREALLRRIVSRFPNTTVDTFEVEADRFRFEVRRCAFVDHCRATGHDDLAQLFCAADGKFFEESMAEVAFERPTTIAGGGPCCDFRFRWREAPDTNLSPAAGSRIEEIAQPVTEKVEAEDGEEDR